MKNFSLYHLRNKPQKIAYLHIGKCAGTTLYDYFKTRTIAISAIFT